MKLLLTAATALLMAAAPPAQKQKPKPTEQTMKHPMGAKPEATFLTPSDLQWGDPPPGIPRAAQAAVLFGDPTHNAPYTVRLKVPDGFKIPGHWHTKDERLTIITGKFVLYLGDDFTAPAHELAAGSFHFLPGSTHHAAEAKGETIIQIDAVGPFDINYLKATDDPRHQASR